MKPELKLELDRLATKQGGILRIDDVIEAARSADSPLHAWPGWTWDKEAGYEENLRNQARKLVTDDLLDYRISVERGELPVEKIRNFVSLAGGPK